jgi:ribonucleoside-diphosphate reductase alpha chain
VVDDVMPYLSRPPSAGAVSAEAGAGPPGLTPTPARRTLPSERRGLIHHFHVGGHEGYIRVSVFEDGTPGELFLNMAKVGSTLSGMVDSFAIMVSIAFQHGVRLETLVRKFREVRFEPSGFTQNPDIPTASSIVDYVFHWLEQKFPDGTLAAA